MSPIEAAVRDWFTIAPQYRTKEKLIEMTTEAERAQLTEAAALLDALADRLDTLMTSRFEAAADCRAMAARLRG